jgi:hypothetical protein
MLTFLYIEKITEESTSESQNDDGDQSDSSGSGSSISGRRSDASDEDSSIAADKGHSASSHHHSFSSINNIPHFSSYDYKELVSVPPTRNRSVIAA